VICYDWCIIGNSLNLKWLGGTSSFDMISSLAPRRLNDDLLHHGCLHLIFISLIHYAAVLVVQRNGDLLIFRAVINCLFDISLYLRCVFFIYGESASFSINRVFLPE